MTSIAKLKVRLFHVPLSEVLVDAKHGAHTIFELITVTITLQKQLVSETVFENSSVSNA